MADTFEFELVSPVKLLFSEPAGMVTVPGVEGDFGVLPGHAPMLSTVRPGVLDVYGDGKIVDRIFIAGGFAEVTEERLTVLAEEAVRVKDIDRAEAEKRLKDAREDLQDAGVDTDRASAEKAVAVAEAMLGAAGGQMA